MQRASLFEGQRRTVTPGSLIELRGVIWKVRRVDIECEGQKTRLDCVGVSGICRSKQAAFIADLEPDLRVLDPAALDLVADPSSGHEDSKLFLESAMRKTPPVGATPLVVGHAAIDDLPFQRTPVERILTQTRPRLLIADDVGLGKTLEAGLTAAELILRQRASRILVITTRAMLTQFQKEFWTRFSIPLARLDSAAIRRMRERIPAHYNVFERFDRAIVSIDTLKRDIQYRDALEATRWDLVIIDEAHNAADRSANSGTTAARALLARRLSRTTDALILLTATPHDGLQSSFASLIRMLDPTRVPNESALNREDIEDLVVRRFRSSPEVQAAMKQKLETRVLQRRQFQLAPVEDEAYRFVAELRLDVDEDGTKRRGLDLFRTTIAKALFSSPAACLETVSSRRRRIQAGSAKGSARDVATLGELEAMLAAISPEDFRKYGEFTAALRDNGWTGRDPRDRVVVFSERIATLKWLHERLATDLGLPDAAVARVDGSNIEADETAQRILEDFQHEGKPVRILLASDIASEGLNLHFMSHRLIHFDLPWSLLRFQQRNGRIDRYGQTHPPHITYFVGESTHNMVRDMWVLEKLVEKDEAAQKGVGDPAVFLRVGDADLEEAKTAEAIANGIGADAFGRQLEDNAAKAEEAGDDPWGDLLFGEYDDKDTKRTTETDAPRPPRLFQDTFTYADRMLRRLAQKGEQMQLVLTSPPHTDPHDRLIRFDLPEEMKAVDDFGYARRGEVDEVYMPREAVRTSGRIELTDRTDVVENAIRQARGDEQDWPQVQYLWDVHPIVGWLNDRAETLFPRFSAPVVRLTGRMPAGEVAVVLHGSVPNRVGTPVVDVWGVVRGQATGTSQYRCGPVEHLAPFLDEIGFAGEVPNRGDATPEDTRPIVARAVDAFQAHLVEEREEKAANLKAVREEALARLEAFKARFDSQLAFDFADVDEAADTIAARGKRRRRDNRRQEIDEMFADWERWHRDTCELENDPRPFVEVKVVFQG